MKHIRYVSGAVIKLYGFGDTIPACYSFIPNTNPAGVMHGPPSSTTHLDYSELKKIIITRTHNCSLNTPFSHLSECIHSLMIHGHQLFQKVQSHHKNHGSFILVSTHLMSCGHISGRWKTRELRRFSLALAI